LFASTFALISTAVFADDSSLMPLSKMDTEQAKAARADAKAKWDKMTPEQQAAARKAASQKRLADANALDMIANENMQYNPPSKAEQAASKAVAKPTKAERAADTAKQTKPTTGQ
jgi:acyl-CoA reductase-like NAD-dependent aldehyde dehydrogenase